MKTVKITWMDLLDKSDVQEAMDESCVDAHGSLPSTNGAEAVY